MPESVHVLCLLRLIVSLACVLLLTFLYGTNTIRFMFSLLFIRSRNFLLHHQFLDNSINRQLAVRCGFIWTKCLFACIFMRLDRIAYISHSRRLGKCFVSCKYVQTNWVCFCFVCVQNGAGMKVGDSFTGWMGGNVKMRIRLLILISIFLSFEHIA